MSSYFHQFLLRRDTLSELDSANPILSSGEPIIALDKNILKIGDGEHRWQDLPSFISSRELKHKSIAASIPSIEINDSYTLYVSFEDIDISNKYAVFASPSTDLPTGIVISHGYVSGNNTIAIKFTNISLANINAGGVNSPANNSSTPYSGTINIIAYMTDEAVVAPVIITTPPPVRDSFYSFGYNNFGQLGLNDIQDRTRPTYAGLPVSGNPENLWNDISLGYYHTLAISKSGDLFSFGYNYYGQLGNGEFGIGKNIRIPTLIESGINWTKVEAGAYHSLAIGDGKLFAFGSNAHGSLGVGDTNLRKDITGLDAQYVYEALQTQASGKILNSKLLLNYDVSDTYIENKLYTLPVGSSIAISLETGYYMAVLNRNRSNLIAYSGVPNDPITTSIIKNVSGTQHDGEYIFYNGNVSLLALGNYDKASLYFYNIATDSFSYHGGENILRSQDNTGWSHISAGHYHSLGIKDGYLYTWGNNAFGQLGLGDNIDRYEPTLISQENTWVDIAAGNYHSLAIKNNGGTYQLYSFGKNDHGQLGLNSSLPQIKIPLLVNSSFNEVSLYNTETLQSGSQINVENLKYVLNYSDGKTYDADDKYVLSEGTYVISGVPPAHPIAFLNAGKTDLFTYVGQNNAGTKVIDGYQYTFYHGNVTINVYGNFDAMSAYGLFYGYMGAEDIFLYDNENATPANIDAGIDFSIVRTDLDEVWTFGKNNLGQLGLGDYNRRIKPHKIKEYDWTHAKTGANHVLLLDSSKRMWSFGDNTYGQLGLGDNFGRNEPTVVNALERYDDINAGGNHSIGAIFSAAPTTPIITNIFTANDTNDIYDRNLRIVWEDTLAEQYGVIDYVIESGVSTDGPWTVYADTFVDDKFVTINGATVGTNYFFRVKSRNEEGFSEYSNISSGIPERLIDDLYCSTMLLLHLDTNFNSVSRFTSTYTGISSPTLNANDSVFGQSYYDNGSNKQLQYFNNQDFNIANDLCCEFYFKTSGVNSENIVRSIMQGNNFTTASVNNEGNSFAILSSGQNIIVAEKQNSVVRTLFTYEIPSNKQSDWNHFAWVRDDLTHKLFFNGVQVSGITQTSVLSYTQNTIRIAGNNTNSNNAIYTSFGMKGWIDEVRITKQPRYTQSFTTDLFKRPFGEVAAENCGAGFGGIPLEFDSAYSWNVDIGTENPQSGLGIPIFNGSSWGGLYTSGITLGAGETIGLFRYYNEDISATYVEIYNNSNVLNSISPLGGITATGSGLLASPLRVNGDFSNIDKIFTINQSGNFTIRVNVNSQTGMGGTNELVWLKNGLPNITQSGVVSNFDKYFVSGVGSVVDPMHVKIGRNFFFNKPRETSKVWIQVKIDGYLDIDAAKFNNAEGFWFYKTKQEPTQHFEYLNTIFGTNSYTNSDESTLNKLNGYLPSVEPPLKVTPTTTPSTIKDYSFTGISPVDGPHYTGTSQQIYYRYENIPIKKGEYIVCGLQVTGNLPTPPNTCSNSGEIILRVREANNLLELNFENDFIDKSSFDHKVIKNYPSSYNLSFSDDSVVGNYSLNFPFGLSTNPILNHDPNAVSGYYRFPIVVDLPINYVGIKEKFTIETFFKFNTLSPTQNEFHRIFAIERPWNAESAFSQYYLGGQKRDYINLTLQTSGTAISNGYLAFNFESSDEFLSQGSTFMYGLKPSNGADDISYTINISPSGLQNLSLSQWNHVSLVRYYDNIILFLNGKEASRSLIGRKKIYDTEDSLYIFRQDNGGSYYVEDVPVVSGDILGLDSTFVTTTSIRSFYNVSNSANQPNSIIGLNNISTTGVGLPNSIFTTNGNYGSEPSIFKYNYTGTVTFIVDAPNNSKLTLVKNGNRKTITTINNDDLQIPPRFDIRGPDFYGDTVKRRIGAPLTIGPINGKMDLFAISADAKYLTNFDPLLLPYRNDEYFSYDGRKYKKRDTFIYDVKTFNNDSLVILEKEFEEIESENRHTSVFLTCNSPVSKIQFSVASYEPNVKLRIRRTNKEKEFRSFAKLSLGFGGTGLILINNTAVSLTPCMSTSLVYDEPFSYYFTETEGSNSAGLHPCINVNLLNYNTVEDPESILSSGLYYQDFELHPDEVDDYIHIEIIHDKNDITTFSRPSIPQNLTATSGYSSLTLNWDGPANYGGERLSGYIIDSSISGTVLNTYTKIPKTNSYTMTGLIGNSGYLLSLAAANLIGSGDFTNPILAYPMPPRQPFAPQNFDIYATSGSMVLNWDAPLVDGGEEITSYNIYYTPLGGSESVFSTQNNRAILTPLINLTQYDVKVAAINEIGSGDYSSIITDTVRPKIISTCGENDNGHLGTSNTTDLNIPSGLQGFNNSWIDISMGTVNACAINASGEVYVWGYNGYGQIGDGTSVHKYVPTKALNPVNNVNLKWKKCSIYTNTLYVISESGLLYGAGQFDNGELGVGPVSEYDRSSRLIPCGYGDTLGKSNWKDVKAGPNNAILLDEDGDIYLTGGIAETTFGQLTYYQFVKVNIPNDLNQGTFLTFKKVYNAPRFVGGSFFLAIDKYSRLIAFTINNYTGFPMHRQVSGVYNCVAAAGLNDSQFGGRIITAVNSSGELYVCGNNSSMGLIGGGITSAAGTGFNASLSDAGSTPIAIKTSGTQNNFVDVSMTYRGIMALNSSGEIWCIGQNHDGVFGIGNTNINAANTSFVKSSGALFYDKISSSPSSSMITLGY